MQLVKQMYGPDFPMTELKRRMLDSAPNNEDLIDFSPFFVGYFIYKV